MSTWKDRIHSIFPRDPKGKIKYDSIESLSYVTPHTQSAKMISSIISIFSTNYSLPNKEKITVIEATGGLGGDTTMFAKHKKVSKVISIELDKERFKCLKHNVSLYKVNAEMILRRDNFVDWFITNRKKIKALKNVCVFVDPPWGGTGYKSMKTIDDLYITDNGGKKYGVMDIVNLVSDTVDMIFFKLPYNFDLAIFNKGTKEYYVMRIKKILFVCIDVRKVRPHKS
jgi:16S rRNA G966 N2-methylase RsmD